MLAKNRKSPGDGERGSAPWVRIPYQSDRSFRSNLVRGMYHGLDQADDGEMRIFDERVQRVDRRGRNVRCLQGAQPFAARPSAHRFGKQPGRFSAG